MAKAIASSWVLFNKHCIHTQAWKKCIAFYTQSLGFCVNETFREHLHLQPIDWNKYTLKSAV